MYRSLGAMWQGWTKNLYPLMARVFRSLLFELLEASPFIELRRCRQSWRFRSLAFEAICCRRQPACRRNAAEQICAHLAALRRNRYPVSYIQYYFRGAALYTAALLGSWWKSRTAGWSGRDRRIRRALDDPNHAQNRIFGAHFYHNPAFSAEENRRFSASAIIRTATGTTTFSK